MNNSLMFINLSAMVKILVLENDWIITYFFTNKDDFYLTRQRLMGKQGVNGKKRFLQNILKLN